MKKKVVIFCSRGLGDGLIFMHLANNFHINRYDVVVFHPFIKDLSDWFPFIKIYSYKKFAYQDLIGFDYIFINEDEKNRSIVSYCKEKIPNKTFIFKPTTCKKAGSQFIDPKKTMVQNLNDFCFNRFFKNISNSNGIIPLKNLSFRKHSKRVVIHTFAQCKERIWPEKKFHLLSKRLKRLGFEAFFLRHEKETFIEEKEDVFTFNHLSALAAFIYESGFFIGNDSGVGHLASSLNIPTLSIFSTKRKRDLWRPDWNENVSVYPYPWIFNFKLFRIRDRYWYKFISVNKVIKKFMVMYEKKGCRF